jgi:hypothetical protein
VYVITLVHGTFAINAEWTRPGSRLREVVQDRLGGPTNVQFHVFRWGGLLGSWINNGHRYRIQAGDQLRSDLLRTLEGNRNAKHFIIAHSHGGNVALYALRDLRLQKAIRGVVCLATPFVHCEARNVESTLRLYPTVAWTLVAFPVLLPLFGFAAVILARSTQVAARISPGLEEPLIGVIASILSIGAYFIFAKLPSKIVDGFIGPWLREWSPRKQRQIVSRLGLPLLSQTPVLCMHVAGDEARRHLGVVGCAYQKHRTHCVD